ncbi:MAG: AbrB family transcriptional regulator [Salinarimonadaceae bacterium]|nr:MAG: AbrB family transcriptional regulator [Salinarimonadaceae bacterium]
MSFFTRRRAATLVVALVGVAVFAALDLPLPFLFGPMIACLIAALAGAKLQGMGQFSIGARTVLGVAVGAAITPALLGQLPVMALSVGLMPLYILLIGLVGVPFFRRLGFDPATSYYAAMPGGLQDMVVFGQEAGADVRALSLIHATRMLIIVTLAPIILTTFYGVSLTNPLGLPAAEIPIFELALMVVAAIVGWKGGERIGLFGAPIIGPLVVTACLSLGGLIHFRPPEEAILAAQVFIGIGIGVHYVGVTLRDLRNIVAAGVAFVILLAALAAAFTEVVTLTGLAQPVEGFLSFAPGGQAEMAMLAIIAGADLGFVVAHHLARIVIVISGAPIAARLMGFSRKPPGADD